jgi:hypothetical protein
MGGPRGTGGAAGVLVEPSDVRAVLAHAGAGVRTAPRSSSPVRIRAYSGERTWTVICLSDNPEHVRFPRVKRT